MSYTNGAIPKTSLVPVAGHPNASLLPGTAAAWAIVRAEVAARFGWTPELTGDLDAYRPYATQESLFRERYSPTPLLGRPTKSWQGRLWWLRPGMATAAVPGTSNHGLGITVDVTGLGGFTGARYDDWAQVAQAHQWSNSEGRRIGEAWHWTFTGNPEPVSHTIPTGTVTDVPTITPPTPLTEDDMDAAQDQMLKNIEAKTQTLVELLGAAGITTGKVDTILQGVVDIRGGVAGLPALLAARDPATIAAAIPTDIARQVADLLAARLAG